LKLRQREGDATAELVFYVRPDAEKARTSEYQKLPAADASGMLRLLRAMFVPGVCVRKRRELWLLGETRVHLDQVHQLGTFVEIEVPFTRNVTEARRVMRMLVARLGIARTDVLACSYADLMARRSVHSE
jgi:predicted adenylyl cyclase CyaB